MGHLARSLAALFVALSALPAFAGTIHVTSGSDDLTTPPAGGIREAITNAQPGDTIVIDPKVTVRLAGDLVVPEGKDLTIEGPAPDGLKIPGKVTQDTPAPVPPAKFIVQGTGTTVRQLTFDGVTLVIDHASATVVTCAFDMHLTGPGVVLKGATGGTIGTPDEVNTFTNCTQGVESQGSANVTVTNNHFSKNDTAVLSIDDKNITVTENQMQDGDGVAALGSSGTVSQNKIKPDKQVGVGIKVGPSPDSLPSQGKVTVTGNQVKVLGQAEGVRVEGRTDVTISSSSIEGKSKAPGIACSIGPAAEAGGALVVNGCTVDGCSPGILCDTTGASNVACTVSNNTVSDCKLAGIDCSAGADGTLNVTGNRVDHCGSGPGACGMRLSGAGADVECDQNVVDACKGDAVRVEAGASTIDLNVLVATNCSGYAIHVESGGAGTAFDAPPDPSAAFAGNRKGFVMIENDGSFVMSPVLFDALAVPASARPAVDVAPRGWRSVPMTAEFDDAGNLVVHVPTGTEEIEVFGNPTSKTFETGGNTDVTIPASELPPGGGPGGDRLLLYAIVHPFDPENRRMDAVFADTAVRIPSGGTDGETHTFTVDKKKVTITSNVGADGSVKVFVTNNDDVAQTLEVGKLTGNFFDFPNGMVTFQPGETKAIEIGHSAMRAVTETVKLLLKFNGGVEAVITCTGITK